MKTIEKVKVNGAMPLARPLKKLAELIQSDLKEITRIEVEEAKNMADRVNERAMIYRIAIGEKLLEAKRSTPHGEFQNWVKDNFPKLPIPTAKRWTRMARQKDQGRSFSSEADLNRQTRKQKPAGPSAEWKAKHPEYGKGRVSTKQRAEWKAQQQQRIDDFLRNVNDPNYGAFDANVGNESAEQKLIKQVATNIVDAGYKWLATKLHPDKGGSEDAMRRLNAAREQLRRCLA